MDVCGRQRDSCKIREKKPLHSGAAGAPGLTRFLRKLDGRGPTHGWGWLELPTCPRFGMAVGEAKLRKMGRMSEMFHVEHFVIMLWQDMVVMTVV